MGTPQENQADSQREREFVEDESIKSSARNFFAELADRKVYHTSVIYVAAGWAILQFADIAGPRLGIPDGVISLLLWILIVGFPVVIVLSWAFEIRAHGWPIIPRVVTRFLISIRFIALWIVLISLAVVFAVLLIGGIPKSSFALSPKDSVVVGHFHNFTSDSLLDDSLGLAFRVGLEQSRHAFVVPHSHVQHALSQMLKEPDSEIDRVLGIQVAQRTGAKALIVGGIGEVGTRYKISTEVIDPNNGTTVLLETKTVNSRDDILRALDRQTRKLRTQLGESIKSVADSTLQLEQVTTSNLDALKAYSLGIRAAGRGEVEDAVILFHRAITLDPEFSMAHAKVAVLYEFALEDTRRATAHRNLALKYGDRLTERERVYVEGHATASATPAEMIRAWRLMRSLYPEDSVGYHNLGTVMWRYENDLPRAAEVLEQAADINNAWQHTSAHNLGYVYLGLGKVDAAIESCETAWKIGAFPSDGGLAHAYIVARQYDKAQDFLGLEFQAFGDQVKFDIENKWIAYYLDQGLFDDAAQHIDLALEHARATGKIGQEHRTTASSVAILERRGDDDAFFAALEELVREELELLGLDEMELGYAPAEHLLFLGKIGARNGKLDLALEILDRVRPLTEDSGFYYREVYAQILAGEAALAQGRTREAIELFNSAAAERPLFQAHESLARAYEQDGDLSMAAAQYNWLIDHRGLPFSEAMSLFYGRDFGILDWAVAHYHVARLNEKLGNADEAAENYRVFIDHWKQANREQPLVAMALQRLSILGEQENTESALIRLP